MEDTKCGWPPAQCKKKGPVSAGFRAFSHLESREATAARQNFLQSAVKKADLCLNGKQPLKSEHCLNSEFHLGEIRLRSESAILQFVFFSFAFQTSYQNQDFACLGLAGFTGRLHPAAKDEPFRLHPLWRRQDQTYRQEMIQKRHLSPEPDGSKIQRHGRRDRMSRQIPLT